MQENSSSKPRGPWTRKPISLIVREQNEAIRDASSQRHLGLFDLVSIGVGGTVGSGIFVLAGFIAHHYAGPATFISFIISGVAASCSGLCYAEFAGRLPASGSTYIYTFVSMGEWAAIISGACLTLEYGVSGAAVARAWGDKIFEYLMVEWGWETAEKYSGEAFFNPLAGLVSVLSVVTLACGIQESKSVTNFFTCLKVALVVFMISGGLFLFDYQNLTALAPFGIAGIFRGATSSFFAFLGYDEVCCMAAEARNPSDVPKAILYTLGIVTFLYVLASLALVGMIPYMNISDTSGFPDAFSARGISWASQVAAAGEVVTLPVVVLISLMAQPRLFAAMANDGLLPAIFAKRDVHGNLFWSSILCGVPMTVLATVVPFSLLDDCISVGILLAFNMTNSSLILMTCKAPPQCSSNWLSRQLFLFQVLSFAAGMSSRITSVLWVPISFVIATAMSAFLLHYRTVRQEYFGEVYIAASREDPLDIHATVNRPGAYRTPFVPMLPLFGIAMNTSLIAQLELNGLALLVLYLFIVSLLYLICCKGNYGWRSDHRYLFLEDEDDATLQDEISMVRL